MSWESAALRWLGLCLEALFAAGHDTADRGVDERQGSAKRVTTNTTVGKYGLKSGRMAVDQVRKLLNYVIKELYK